MTEVKPKAAAITLDAGKTPDAKVVVQDDGGVIYMGIGDAIASCVVGHRMLGSIREEMGHVLEYMREWVERNSDRVRKCHIDMSHGKFFILIAPRAEEYDFELGKRLAELSIELTKSYRFAFDLLQCPAEGFGGFVRTEGEASADANRA